MNKIKTFSLKSILTANGEVLSYGPGYTTGHLRAARRLSRFCFELYCGCTGEETGSKFVKNLPKVPSKINNLDEGFAARVGFSHGLI